MTLLITPHNLFDHKLRCPILFPSDFVRQRSHAYGSWTLGEVQKQDNENQNLPDFKMYHSWLNLTTFSSGYLRKPLQVHTLYSIGYCTVRAHHEWWNVRNALQSTSHLPNLAKTWKSYLSISTLPLHKFLDIACKIILWLNLYVFWWNVKSRLVQETPIWKDKRFYTQILELLLWPNRQCDRWDLQQNTTAYCIKFSLKTWRSGLLATPKYNK